MFNPSKKQKAGKIPRLLLEWIDLIDYFINVIFITLINEPASKR
jgi:hypothetical protein